jgi:hypothetical protein
MIIEIRKREDGRYEVVVDGWVRWCGASRETAAAYAGSLKSLIVDMKASGAERTSADRRAIAFGTLRDCIDRQSDPTPTIWCRRLP